MSIYFYLSNIGPFVTLLLIISNSSVYLFSNFSFFINMHSIRRLVASRQIASLALPRASASTQLRSISRLAAAPSAWTRPVNASVSQRWYSEKASEEQSKPEQATEVSEVDSLKKQIEAKEKEVIDLKVCFGHSPLQFDYLN